MLQGKGCCYERMVSCRNGVVSEWCCDGMALCRVLLVQYIWYFCLELGLKMELISIALSRDLKYCDGDELVFPSVSSWFNLQHVHRKLKQNPGYLCQKIPVLVSAHTKSFYS